MAVGRFDVYLVSLDPTVGSEIKKTRPCLVVSPDEMNRHIRTVIVAPMTTKGRPYPTRVPCRFRGKAGQVVIDQIRTIDAARMVRNLGRRDAATGAKGLAVLGEMFAPESRRSRTTACRRRRAGWEEMGRHARRAPAAPDAGR